MSDNNIVKIEHFSREVGYNNLRCAPASDCFCLVITDLSGNVALFVWLIYTDAYNVSETWHNSCSIVKPIFMSRRDFGGYGRVVPRVGKEADSSHAK